MRIHRGFTEGLLLAFAFALPVHAASRCTDAEQNTWLNSCAWALDQVHRAESPSQTDQTDVLFKATNLADDLVGACNDLVAQPDRIPAKTIAALWPTGWPPLHDRCDRAQHLKWLRSCTDDALRLIGHTRADLLKSFREEGGLSTNEDRTFVHRRCGTLKVDVHFSVTRMEAESQDDVVDTVYSYLGCEVFD